METTSLNPLFIFFLFFCLLYSSVSIDPSDLAFESTYSRLCNHLVPAPAVSNEAGTVPGVADELRFQSGYFSGGDRLFNRSATLKHVSFRLTSVRRSATDGVFQLRGKMLLQQRRGEAPAPSPAPGRLLRRVTHWRVSKWMRVTLSGFWSQFSGNLCMYGTGTHVNMENANVVLKLRYPRDLSLVNCLISGTLESYDGNNSLQYFEPISILALSQSSKYKFTVAGNERENGCGGGSDREGLSLGNLNQGACTAFLGHTDWYELEYGSQCGDGSCNPVNGSGEELPGYMLFHGTLCAERKKVQILLGFPDSGYQDAVFPFQPNTTLVSEGMWDEKENRLCAVACRIMNFTDSSWLSPYVGDCKIRLTLHFPAILSLRNRSTVLGQIWSDKVVDEPGYFSSVGFRGSSRVSKILHGFQYKYAETEKVTKSCVGKMNAGGKGNTYPNGYSSDMAFRMLVTDSKGKVAQGYSSPLSVNDQIYNGQSYGAPTVWTTEKPKAHGIQSENYSNLLNVSYTMIVNSPPDFKFGTGVLSTEVKIGAEGIYNKNNGVLCMIGCRLLRSMDKILIKNESLDCEIMVNVQFPPLNAKGDESLKGTIESTRQKSDPYHFDPLRLSSYSIYTSQADASIRRMDFELIMLLVSNTLACVFVGMQLLHVKKHPDVLPYISVVMLAVITLGHMIPLILNFEALFKGKHSLQNAFLGSGGWLEVNEVVVRMVTMVAFLLELRLVQLTWTSRQGEGNRPGLWGSDKKVLYMILPLYIGGGLTACLVHIWKISRQNQFKPFRLSRHKFNLLRGHVYQPPSLWEDFKSYAGLLLDGFLLPQILLNIIFNSEGKALATSFYVGITIVRILPHAYDLFRAHSSAWYLDLSYIYANHRMDFYSTAWDIIIPSGGIFFALLLYFQQRFGSRCILPKKFRGSSAYEKVPVIGNDDL
ncbi:unnamed protein product [Sphenostylis stenocarpa]|uniref:RING-type E3 ubiquitin transferase n=1 Tax=Sphenostylis stenocarpa TaxID=92480 RepID=A0AA86VS27_9FABA|nr:unnamed protein product [Sphenostylis stenocarpa]